MNVEVRPNHRMQATAGVLRGGITFAAAVYNLVRIRNLAAATG